MGLRKTSLLAGVSLFIAFGIAAPSHAAMLAFQTFNGNVDISIDGFGPKGGLTAHVPVGSKVVAAYLYKQGGSAGSTDSFGGAPITFEGLSGSNPPDYVRADVTDIVGPSIENGSGNDPSFDSPDAQDKALVIVYEEEDDDDEDDGQTGNTVGVVSGDGDPCPLITGVFCKDVEKGTVGSSGSFGGDQNGGSVESLFTFSDQSSYEGGNYEGEERQVPEPATLGLLGMGLLGLGAVRRRMTKA